MSSLKDLLITQTSEQIDNIDGVLSQHNVFGAVGVQLQNNKSLLQNQLNELLQKKGVISESEYSNYYANIQKTSSRQIEKSFIKQNLIFTALAVVLVVSIYYFYNKKK